MARKRKINKKLIDSMSGDPCFICGAEGEVHHIIYKSKLGPDEPFNLINLCHFHHVHELHKKGYGFMFEKYPQMKEELRKRGFEILKAFGRVIIHYPQKE